jgi:DNA-binding CsgD family transcriptional regulator
MQTTFNSEVENQLCRLQLALTQDTVWRTSLRMLRAAVPFDALKGIRYYGGRPMLLRTTHPVPDEAAYLARLAEVGLWWGDAAEPGPAADVRRLSDIRDGGSLRGWRHYEEFLQPQGWCYLAGLLFRGEHGDFLGQLTLHRTREQGDFSEEELAMLRRLHPHIGAAVKRLVKLDGRHSGRSALEKVLRTLPLRVVIANWHGEVEFLNRAAIEALHVWKLGTDGARSLVPETKPRLPPEIALACADLRQRYQEAVREDRFRAFTDTVRVAHPLPAGGQADVSILPADFRQAIHPSFLIDIRPPEPLPNADDIPLEKLAKLTPSERSVARRAGEGASNSEIAAEMKVSVSTVRTHLRNAFDKLGIDRRAKLAGVRELLV